MMKKAILAAALTIAGMSGAQAAHYAITLDGFCNTFDLTTSSWQVWGVRSGCGYDVNDGGVVAKFAGAKYITPNDSNATFNGDTGLFTWIFTKPVRGSGTGSWYLYYSNGTSQSLLNQGTYSPTPNGKTHRAGKDATIAVRH